MSSRPTRSCTRRSCGARWAKASRCACSSAMAKSTRPSARWPLIQARRAEGGAVKFGDFAVLYRANHQARVFEQKLRAAQIAVQGLGRAELLRPRRDPRPLRLVAPVGQPGRRPGLPARRDHAQTRHRPADAGRARRVRRALEVQPVRGAVLGFTRQRAESEGAGLAARVRPPRQRPRTPRPSHRRQRRRQALPARLAQGHRLRAAPVRRRRQRQARRRALDQRARLRRLDLPPMRRHGQPGSRQLRDPRS